ncbi:MAG TPA: dethiobiotin synthase, partial [Legionellaceae bacterium]|nr:dethiobiotin synthase [Legionellaceae bacterium]
MLKQYFILGTDTDCGKTYVTIALLKYFHSLQQKVYAIKPIASGCTEVKGQLLNADIQALQIANGNTMAPINRWTLPLPLSPHLAAKAHQTHISAAAVLDFCQQYPQHDLAHLLIEGAGGLM